VGFRCEFGEGRWNERGEIKQERVVKGCDVSLTSVTCIGGGAKPCVIAANELFIYLQRVVKT
jgi:hypothetical protein